MKKALRSLVVFAFALTIIFSTLSLSLAAPGSFKLKATIAPTAVKLTWTKSENADKYIVQQYKGRWTKVTELSADTTSYTIKKLKTGESYTYRIQAVEDGSLRDTTTNSNQLTVKPSVAKVSSLKAAQYNYNTVKLTWKKISGVTGYQIYQYNSKTKKWSKVKTVSSKYNYAYIKSLKSGTTYKFRVRAYLKSGKTYYGSYSSTASVKAGVPAATVKVTTSYNAVKLSWNKVKDATGYRIYKYDSAKKKWVTSVKSTTKTSYTFKDLKTGTSYSYRVRPYQKVSKTIYWGSYETIKATPSLAKPSGFKDLPATLTTLGFKWNKVSGAAGYRVYRYNTSTKKWDVVLKSTKDTSFTDSKLEPGTQYSYKVKAYRKVNGAYVYSAASSTYKVATEALNTVGEMRVISRTQTSLTLSWDDIGADGYEIYTSSGSGIAHVNETTVTINNLKPGTTYVYKMKAYFIEDGERIYTGFTKFLTASTEEKETEPSTKPTEPSTKPTEPSTKPTEPSTKPTEPSTKPTEPSTKPTEPSTKPTEPSTKPTEPSTKPTEPSTKPTEPSTKPTEPSTKPTPVVPAKVTGLQKVSATETSISVKWNASSNATSYTLNFRVKGSATWFERSTRLTNNTISGLAAGTQYEIKVTAMNDSTAGEASDILTVSTSNPPVAPSKVAGLQKVSVTETSISVKWNASTNATSYMLSYRVKGASTWSERSTNTTNYEITGLTAGTQYEIKVTAANSSTTGEASDVLTVSTSSKAPEAAKILTATTVDENQIKLSWDAINGASTYDLQYYSSVDNEWQTVPGANNLTAKTFTDTPAKSGRTYCGYLYRVVGRNSLGNEVAVSNAVTGTTKGLTVTQDKYQATIKWDKISGSKSYSLLTYVKNLGSVPVKEYTEFTANSATIYLAPGDIHSFTLISNNTDGSSKVIFSGLSVVMPELDVSDNSDKGMNAKLLYLERAINRTKYVNDDIRVKYNSVSDYEIYYLKSGISGSSFFAKEYNGTDEVQKFFDLFNDDTSEPLTSKYSDIIDEDISFRYGSGKNAKGKVVYLKYILEPATNSDNYYLAYIYDGQKPANWKNGFSQVDVKENADGSCEYTVVLKQEKLTSTGKSNYHGGLFESVGSIGESDEADINSATVGATTIKAKIGADGVLQTYEIESPFDSSTELKFMGIGSVTTKIRGKNKTTYIFTK